jgi:hypothetical protein
MGLSDFVKFIRFIEAKKRICFSELFPPAKPSVEVELLPWPTFRFYPEYKGAGDHIVRHNDPFDSASFEFA